MKNSSCPNVEDLSRWEDGELDPARREELERHLAECRSCRERGNRFLENRWLLRLGEEETASSSASSSPGVRRFVFSGRHAAAAAVLLAAGLGGWMFVSHGNGAAQPGENFLVAEEGNGTVEPWSGIRIVSGVDSRWEMVEERPAVRLVSGRLEADIAPGRAGFEVETPAGTVRVVGTRFSVQADRLEEPPLLRGDIFSNSIPFTFVEVESGGVELRCAQGSVLVRAGTVGFLLEGRKPFAQKRVPLTRDLLLKRLTRLRELASKGDRREALELWGALAASARDSTALLARVAGDAGVSGPDRAAAAALGRRWDPSADWDGFLETARSNGANGGAK